MQRKLFWSILICNLFLTFTVLFFQPLVNLLVNTRSIAFPVWRVWWIQVLIALVITAILTVVMINLPIKAKRIAILLSLGLGISFLIQSLLFNIGRPFDMNTTWEMKIGCVLIWLWIVLFVVTTGYYFLEKRERITKTVIVAMAWVLILIQGVNYVMLSTSYDRLAHEPGYLTEEQSYIKPGELKLISFEETVMRISLNRGLPYLIKDGFSVPDAEIYDKCFARAAEGSK